LSLEAGRARDATIFVSTEFAIGLSRFADVVFAKRLGSAGLLARRARRSYGDKFAAGSTEVEREHAFTGLVA
jgi:hypothetical protein